MTENRQVGNGNVCRNADERDAKIAQILEELSEKNRDGGRADLDEIVRRHPELADELRDLWLANLFVEEVATCSETATRTAGSSAVPL